MSDRVQIITPPPADVEFFVPGKCVTQGSHGKNKHGQIIHSAKGLGAWRREIERAARDAAADRDPIPNGHPAVVRLTFLEQKGSSLPQWRKLPVGGGGDLDKLARAAFDGIAWNARSRTGAGLVRNDGQIHCLPAVSYFADPLLGEEPGLRVQVWAADRDLERAGKVPTAVWTYVDRADVMTLGGIA